MAAPRCIRAKASFLLASAANEDELHVRTADTAAVTEWIMLKHPGH